MSICVLLLENTQQYIVTLCFEDDEVDEPNHLKWDSVVMFGNLKCTGTHELLLTVWLHSSVVEHCIGITEVMGSDPIGTI